MDVRCSGLSVAIRTRGDLARSQLSLLHELHSTPDDGHRQDVLAKSEVDPEFDDPYSINPLNRTMREASLKFLESKLGHDPELMGTMTP